MDGYVTHDLKLSINFCDAVYNGRKSFEIRRNDRGFQTGDHIKFIPFRGGAADRDEMFPDHPIKTREYVITYLLNGWGLQVDYCVMAIKEIDYGS